MVAGAVASAVQLSTWPLRHPGEAAAAKDAVATPRSGSAEKMCWTWGSHWYINIAIENGHL